MTGGVCSATRSVEECFFFDIDVKGGERSRVRNVSGTDSSLIGRMQRRAEWSNEWSNASVAINAKGGDCWQILNKQRMRVDGCCH
jgi:hypothetical protein